MATFQEQLEAFAVKAMNKATLTVAGTIRGVAASIISRSPVGDPATWEPPHWPKGYVPGTFKANWNGALGDPDLSTTDETDPTGELSMTRINSAIPTTQGRNDLGQFTSHIGDQVFYITNSLPYAQRLEDGWSKQAPAGMVGLTVIDFPEIVSVASLAETEIGLEISK